MKLQMIAAALASSLIGVTSAGFAQTKDTFTHGESKRCESLSGAEKDQCDREEATKTQGPGAQTPGAAGSQQSAPDAAASGSTFTHGESKRCESLSGADKDRCDREEATKTQEPAAEKASE